MPTRFSALSLAAALLLTPAHAAVAGIGDKEVPLLSGSVRGKVLYTLTGVINNSNNMGTAVVCTSTVPSGGSNVILGVEFFTNTGSLVNDITSGDGVVTILPGRTVAVVTQRTEILLGAEIVTFRAIIPGS